ncbi:signal transduction histidine kinase [Thermanaerovibrio velox DSM 12556]|uniref:histidine kinase n=1 Tax=Thermanaerovibrio velox DSM 12556 TaxID=926567 RepID=H0UMZ6_9BACT|nr:ATP-binding protein [Thermanaerovibrio velox]EHM09275.1 signal transduction histidine kinase [Thermanaerovibrio velox DSM 12556]
MFKSIKGQAALLMVLPLAAFLGLSWILVLGDTWGYLEEYVRHQLSNLTGAAEVAVRAFGDDPKALDAPLRAWAGKAEVRVTLVDRNGTVLLDTEVPRDMVSKMENHLLRPEIRKAFELGEGYAVRRSDTTGAEYLYEARRLDGATPMVIRVSMRKDIFYGALSSLRRRLWLSFAISFGLAMVIGAWWMRRLTDPILAIAKGADAADAGEEPEFPSGGPAEIRRLSLSLKRMYRRLNRTMEELRRERGNLRGLVETMPVGVLLLGTDRRAIYCNSAMERLVRALNCQGLPMEGVIRHPEVIELGEALLKGARSVESTVTVQDGSKDTSYLVRGASAGDLAVLTAQDISERVKLEETLRNFVADVGHEFQTPLTAIRGAAELLLQGASEEDQRFVKRILEQQERLSDMVDRLLMLARCEGGSAGPVEELDLVHLVREAAEQVSLMPEAPSVEVRMELPTSAPVRCGRDVVTAVRNLLENAVKYTAQKFQGREGGVVTVRLQDMGDRWALAVEDNGPGIPEGMEETVFQRFRRGEFHRARQSQGGYGLGLAIARGILRANGGDVRLNSSRPGEGSKFLMELPKSK